MVDQYPPRSSVVANTAMSIRLQAVRGDFEYCDHLYDMVWIDQHTGEQQPDCSFLYGRYSAVLAAAFKHSTVIEGLKQVVKTGFLQNCTTFEFLKQLCHYDQIALHRNDKFNDLLQIYKMLKCYAVHESVCRTLLIAVVSKLDAANTVQTLNDLVENPFCELLRMEAERLFKLFPVECLGKCKHITEYILELCLSDDLNISEEQLMNLLKDKGQIQSIPDIVRCSGLSFEYLMQFRGSHPGVFSDEWYMSALQEIHTNDKNTHRSKRHVYGCFPHYVSLKSQVEVTLDTKTYTVVFLTVPVQRHSTIALPSFNSCAGVVSIQAEMTSTHIGLRGTINQELNFTGTASPPLKCSSIECRLLNYSKNINKTHSATNPEKQFFLERIITLNTLTTEGYCFNKSQFPILATGNDLLVRLNISAEHGISD